MQTKEIQSIDTNVLLRLTLGDVPAQRKRAVDLLLDGHLYYVSDLAITEAIFTMERGFYKIPRDKAADDLLSVLSNSCIIYNNELFDEVFPYYLRHPKLSFNDCVLSFEAARAEREPLWTFDQDLAKQSPVAKLVS